MHNLKELKQTKNVFVVETVILFLSQFAMTILTHLILGMQKSCKCKMKFQSRSTKTDFESKNIYYQTKKNYFLSTKILKINFIQFNKKYLSFEKILIFRLIVDASLICVP